MVFSSDDIEHREAIAHLLRRTTFGPAPGMMERFAHRPFDDIVDEVLAATGDRALVETGADTIGAVDPPAGFGPRVRAIADGTEPDIPTDDDGRPRLTDDDIIQWWLARLRDPEAGLHERMVWYWHGHFTSHIHSGESAMVWRQHTTIRRHALGNFRDLTREMLRDPLMLVYLNGNGSSAEAPNENLARELMELFTLGVGNYTEDDVKAGARALSGWWVEWEDATSHFDPDRHYDRPITFLGERGRFGVDDVVDAVCDHPACPAHVATRLYRHLVGADPDVPEVDRLARVFRAADLAIEPLVAAIVRSDGFIANRRVKPRQPVEWLISALSALGADDAYIDQWQLYLSGQVPLSPPNVAGWPDDDRWLGGSQILHRVNEVLRRTWDRTIDTDVEPTVDAVLHRCSLYDVSDETRAAMQAAIDRQTEYAEGLELLFALALCSPEFALA